MSIPQFPSQDLAKLVLGYLAEEQLMTVYDEFLMASPYLDALENEYNRILMKSLESIVAEYWAAKIYVEKCKPFSLRKKLLQYTNLLDVVKFLINNVDMRKLQMHVPNLDNNGAKSFNNISQSKVCNQCSLGQQRCLCQNSRLSVPDENSFNTPSNATEATPLTDLPGTGHAITRRKHVKVLDKNSSEAAQLSAGYCPSDETIHKYPVAADNTCATNQQSSQYASNSKSNLEPNELNQNFYDAQIVNKNVNINATYNSASNVGNRNIAEGIFPGFASGVNGAGNRENMSIPDSSTSDVNNVTQHAAQIVINTSDKYKKTVPTSKVTIQTPYLVQMTNANNFNTINSHTPPSLLSCDNGVVKSDTSKITILSDVKVDNTKVGQDKADNMTCKMPASLQCASSTPMLRMQTIVINGTPAYRCGAPTKNMTFTREEILAMPTLIVVSAPGPPIKSQAQPIQTCVSQASVSVTSSTSTAPSLGPLTIDITNSAAPHSDTVDKGVGLIKTVDNKNPSVPKDSVVGKTSTPHALPPTRKSSSTPRRISHVRVLDFATPRRILHETINENPAAEVLISQSPNLHNDENTITTVQDPEKSTTTTASDSSLKENKVTLKTHTESSWDSALRALISSETTQTSTTKTAKSTCKSKAKKKTSDKKATQNTKTESSAKNVKTTKKRRRKTVDNKTDSPEIRDLENTEVPVKPIINVITERKSPTLNAPEKQENTAPVESIPIDTPEMERHSLHNEIGAKLNISDILETPFKQALYDIQMDTPKFLRPDIPIEPVSDIKITDIPTPRFFEMAGLGFTPKANTPSSYSSRPTDYSSGGSYYKPDDHDYGIHLDDIIGTTTEMNKSQDNGLESEQSKDKPVENKSLRPVRKCTKNISYCDNRGKTDDKTNENELSSNDVSSDKVEHDNATCMKLDSKPKSKREPRRKSSGARKTKSPVKKATPKKFLKIKPRRPTPSIKDNKRISSISSDTPQTKTQSKKRASNKDKVHSTPIVNPAPTKSRRKSSTPRKLHTKTFNMESSDNNSSPTSSDKTIKEQQKCVATNFLDSDTEHLPLRWSDEGSQETKSKDSPIGSKDSEDITKIKEYIEQSIMSKKGTSKDVSLQSETTSLHKDLVKRGFDIETAKSIERDLLDSSPQCVESVKTIANYVASIKENDTPKNNAMKEITMEVSIDSKVENDLSDSSVTNNLQIAPEAEDEVDVIELSVCEHNEDEDIVVKYDDTLDRPKTEIHKLKENFCMEICIEEDFSIKLKTSAITSLIDIDPVTPDNTLVTDKHTDSEHETDIAVKSILNFDRLYTPMKDSRAQCKEIFDSTLTSLDTPLKCSPTKESSVSEVVLEVEQVIEIEEFKDKEEEKKRKRKRAPSGHGIEEVECKRNRRETTRYLPNIQNIDIESVLSKLHGP